MFDLPISQILYQLLLFCFGIILTILVANNVVAPVKERFRASIIAGVLTAVTVLTAFAWMISFITAVVFEGVGLDAATAGAEPTFKAEYLLVPVALSFLFPIFVANSWRLGVALSGALGVATFDLIANVQIAEAFACVRGEIEARALTPPPALDLWFAYYLENDHPARVLTYGAILALGMLVYLFWAVRARRAARAAQAPPDVVIFAPGGGLRLGAHACFVVALVLNGAWTWSLRLEREEALTPLNMSAFFSLEPDSLSATAYDVALIMEIQETCGG